MAPDSRAGGRRRRRAEDEAHVRDVLLALGGSPDQADQAGDEADDLSLGSRIDAYTRLVRHRSAPTPSAADVPVGEEPALPASLPPEPVAAPAPMPQPVVVERPARTRVKRPARVRARRAAGATRALVHKLALVALATTRLFNRAAVALIHLARHGARLLVAVMRRAAEETRPLAGKLVHAALALAPPLRRATARILQRGRHALRRVADFPALVLGAVAAPLKRRARPVRRHDDRREPEHLAVGVTARVREWSATQDARDRDDPEPEDAIPDADVATFEARLPETPAGRRWASPAGSALLAGAAAVVAVVALTLVLVERNGGDPSHTQAQSTASPDTAPQPVPSRAAYSDPRAYAAAMTRLALTSGRTEVDGRPVCVQGSTYDRWSCRARGRPTVGAYAGRWLMYRCSPTSTPQPGGRPAAVMINCKPESPPPLTT